MLNIYRILSFVPPALLFFVPAFSQIQGKLEQIPGSDAYKVSVVPAVNWSPPMSVTSSAQITLRASTGKLTITGLQSFTGVWTSFSPVVAPVEAPGYDYFTFTLNQPFSDQHYVNGTPLPLFSFKNSLGCADIEIVDNQSDPFLPPNSLSANIGNFFSILGAGIGQNAFIGNTSEYSVECDPLDIYVLAENNPVKCHGDNTNILVQVFGGNEPYIVNWQNATTGGQGGKLIADYQGVAIFENMAPGEYTFEVKDITDSTQQKNLNVQEPAPLTAELAAYDASCNGSLDGVAYVNQVQGGTPGAGFQYFWSTDPTVSSPSVGFLDPGTYSVTIVDANGCQTSGSVTVGSFAVIYPNPYIRDITCHGAQNGIIYLYPVGPNPPFTYTWSSNVSTFHNSSAWQLGPGYYSVTLTDATGVCHEVAEFFVEEPSAIEVDYGLTEPRCFGEMGFLNIMGVSNAFEPWQAEVTNGLDMGDGMTFELVPGLPTQLIITDSKGCVLSEDFLLPARQAMYLELGEGFTIKYGEEVKLNPNIFPLGGVTLSWTPEEGLSCSDCSYPVASPKKTTTYRLRMTDPVGCVMEDNLTIGVRVSRDIYIPNAFSPNNDGINDIFKPFGGFEVTAIQSMMVFDRWGGMVYSSEKDLHPGDPQLGWDGTARGKPAGTGTYLYSLNVEFVDGEVVLFSGEVNLVR